MLLLRYSESIQTNSPEAAPARRRFQSVVVFNTNNSQNVEASPILGKGILALNQFMLLVRVILAAVEVLPRDQAVFPEPS